MRLIDIEDFYDRDKYEVLIITKGEGRTVARMLDFPEIKAYTKDEVIDMLEKLKNLIENLPTYRNYITDGVSTYGYTEREPSAKDAVKHIQAKINALIGEKNE